MTTPNIRRRSPRRDAALSHRELCRLDANLRNGPKGGPERPSPVYQDGDVRRCQHGRLQMVSSVPTAIPGSTIVRVPRYVLRWLDLSRLWNPFLWKAAERALPAGTSPAHEWVPIQPPRGPSPTPPPVQPRQAPKRKAPKP